MDDVLRNFVVQRASYCCEYCTVHQDDDPLFNPRKQSWREHFVIQGSIILGLTPTGRATVDTLAINSDRQVKLRTVLGYPNRFPKQPK